MPTHGYSPVISFRTKLYIIIVAAMLFAGGMNLFFIYPYMQQRQFESVRQELMAVAQTAALAIDAEKLQHIPLKPAGVQSPEFREIGDQLSRIQQANPIIRYIYTMTRTPEQGVWQFVVDVDVRRNVLGPRSCIPGARYKAARFEEMYKAFDGPSADTHLERDEWGWTLSGYAPVRDAQGRAVAILGIDMAADQLYRLRQEMRQRTLISVVIGTALFMVIGTLLAGRISKPVRKLVEGTRHVGEGNLDVTIELGGRDELSELARAFNAMTQNLREARVKLTNYFYGVAQSFVKALEAKDAYIRGHSERVAGYAEMIAAEMGLAPESVALIRQTALLHDIGKLGVDESILNKKGKLTAEEWEAVRRHPVIGEEILKPLSLSDDIPAIIRSHHSRYDGTGYPPKSGDERVNLYAAIIAVADSYDAMVFSRSYRAAMSVEDALRELTANSGTQFDPRAVQAFLAALKKNNQLPA